MAAATIVTQASAAETTWLAVRANGRRLLDTREGLHGLWAHGRVPSRRAHSTRRTA